MQFADHVPEEARAYIRRTLEGDDSHWKGVTAFIAEYRATGVKGFPLQVLERERDCLHRFAHDLRMKDAYAELQKTFSTSKQYADFLSAAWQADIDYGPYRDRLKKAKDIAPKVAAAARELSSLLNELATTHTMPPSELYSIRALLDATNNDELYGHNFHIWRSVRECITGTRRKLPSSERSTPETDSTPKKVIVIREDEDIDDSVRNDPDTLVIILKAMSADDVETDPETQTRNMLGYAWEKAPDLPAILEVVAHTAEDWAPQEMGAVGAAVSNRQKNPRTEYIRAFASILRERMRIEIKGPLVAAIATTTDVVLNLDTTTSADNVRKTLEDSA